MSVPFIVLPKRLLSLSVRQKSGNTLYGPYTGAIRFKNSYNTRIVEASEVLTQRLRHFAVTQTSESMWLPGTGYGYYPVCGSGYDEMTHEQMPQPIKKSTAYGRHLAAIFYCLTPAACMPAGQQL
jgi:hypothetical protein